MTFRRPGAALLAAALLAATAAGCSSSEGSEGAGDRAGGSTAPEATTTAAPSTETMVFPGAEWETAEPEDLGFDAAVLEKIAAEAEASESSCLLVVRRGRVVGEWNWGERTPDTPREAWSVTKSFTSTLVGLAVADGDLRVDQPATDFIEAWKDTPSASITIENLLKNDSGRFWDFQGDYVGLVGAPNRSEYAIARGQAEPPGTVWVYNNSAIQTLSPILAEATGMPTEQFAKERLLTPIGMAHSELTTDSAGTAATFMGLHTTCRDLARFGHLFLNKGTWDGTEVVPASWVEAATGRSSQELNPAYGYLWWLNRKGKGGLALQAVGEEADDSEGTQIVEDLPEDTFWALGLGNQVVQVDPSTETVVVRMGPAMGAANTFGMTKTATVVTDALTDPDR